MRLCRFSSATRGGRGGSGGVGGYLPSLLLANQDDVLRWMIANNDDVLRWMMKVFGKGVGDGEVMTFFVICKQR